MRGTDSFQQVIQRYRWYIEFDTNECSSNSSKTCVLEIEAKYPKELRGLHNGYPLTPDKIEIKKKMLPNYQLKIADSYNIPMGNINKSVPKLFW